MSTLADTERRGTTPSDRMTPEYQARLRTGQFMRRLDEQLKIQRGELAQVANIVKTLAERINALEAYVVSMTDDPSDDDGSEADQVRNPGAKS